MGPEPEPFGHYRLETLVGRGGMGEVYRAYDTVRNRVVAIKLLPPQLAADPEFRARFSTEAAVAARLSNPHVIPVHDFGEIDGRLYIDMRLVDGVDLAAQLAAHGPLILARAVDVVSQVASALDAAHADGLVHRDIKPSNVLLAATGGDDGARDFVYVADFGIARSLMGGTSLTRTGAMIGTLDYMAPECFTGARIDHRVDVYALGCLLHETLTATKPFAGGEAAVLLYAHLNLPPPQPSRSPGVPAAFDAVVACGMAKDPDQRYRSAGALATVARAALRVPATTRHQPHTPPLPHTPPVTHTPLPQPQPQLGRRRALLLGGTLVTVGLVAGAATLLGTSHPDGTEPDARAFPAGATVTTYRGHTNGIRVLGWSPDGRRIASGSDDGTAHCWDANTGANPVVYRGHASFVEGVAWAPDSRELASSSADSTVQIWDPVTGTALRTYRGHVRWVNRISWSPDGRYIVSGEQASEGGTVVEARVWDVASLATAAVYRGHQNGIFAVAWSPDGAHVVSCGYDGTVQVWDALTGTNVWTSRDNRARFGLSWSPDSRRVVVSEQGALTQVLDAGSGQVLYSHNGQSEASADAAWSPDGRYIAAATHRGAIELLDAQTGAVILTHPQPGGINAVVWSPDSRRVASGSNDSSVHVWRAV